MADPFGEDLTRVKCKAVAAALGIFGVVRHFALTTV